MKSEYVNLYRELYNKHWWWRSRESSVIQAIKHLDLPKDASILDVGCGDGFLFSKIESFGKVQGVEIDSTIVSQDSVYKEHIHIGDILDLSLPNESFDLILALDVIEHVSKDKEFLVTLHSLIRPNGFLIITVPTFMMLWTAHDDTNDHKRRYSGQQLRKILEDNNFTIVRMHFLFFSLAFAKLLQVLIEKLLRLIKYRKRLKVEKIPHPFLNYFIIRWFIVENKIIQFLGLPFGSSVLAITKKEK
jgi:2-polyprenyl-3-methyl-5-hydroxy-6-metoxy-1,4-benzoquinol methylase